jgi:hypothetical protein
VNAENQKGVLPPYFSFSQDNEEQYYGNSPGPMPTYPQ